MTTERDEIEAVNNVTKDDPKMRSVMLKILDIERKYPDEESLDNKEIRLDLLDKLIKKSVDEDNA